MGKSRGFPRKQALQSSTRCRCWRPNGGREKRRVRGAGAFPGDPTRWDWAFRAWNFAAEPSAMNWRIDTFPQRLREVCPSPFSELTVIQLFSSKNQLLLLPQEWRSTVGSLVSSLNMLNLSRASSTSALQTFLGYPSREQVLCHQLQLLACGGKQK